MKSMKSPWVTGCDAMQNASSQTRWRGVSLSKQKSWPECPISRKPFSKAIQRGSCARNALRRHRLSYGRLNGQGKRQDLGGQECVPRRGFALFPNQLGQSPRLHEQAGEGCFRK